MKYNARMTLEPSHRLRGCGRTCHQLSRLRAPTQDLLHALPRIPPSAFKALCIIIFFFFNFLFNACSASFCFSLTSLQPPALPTTFLFSVLRASTFLLRAPPVPSGQVPVPERPAAFPRLQHPQLESHRRRDPRGPRCPSIAHRQFRGSPVLPWGTAWK